MENGKANYRQVLIVEGVQVNVPRDSDFMVKTIAHSFETASGKVIVPTRWKNSMMCGDYYDQDGKRVSVGYMGRKERFKQLIISRSFYDISEDDLGRRIVATVIVSEKTTAEGRKFTLLDFHKNPNGRATCEMKILPDQAGIDILNSGGKKFIHFRPLYQEALAL